jgi:peroxiredoxin
MKSTALFFFIFSLLLGAKVSSAQDISVGGKAVKPFELKLKIKDFANGYLRLAGISGDQNFGIDSAFVDAAGTAVFKIDSGLPSGMYFILFPDNSIVQLLVDKEQQLSLEFSKADVINTMKAIGSVDNELFYKNLLEEMAVNKPIDSIQKLLKNAAKGSNNYNLLEAEVKKMKEERKRKLKWYSDSYPNSFFTKFKLAGQNPDTPKPLRADGSVNEALYVFNYRNDFWNGYDFSDARLLRTPVYFNKLKKFILDLTPQVPDSIIKYADWVTMKSKADKEVFKFTANWIALYYKEAKILGRESVYVFMVEKFWTPDQAFWSKDYEIQRLRMQAKEMKVSLIGQTGHDVKGVNEKGQAIALYDSKAPVTIVYMYSYDCDNCKKETPKMVKLYNEWKGKGLDLFTICIDGEPQPWKDYLQQNGLANRNILDPGNTSNFRAHYYFEVTPGIFVLDRNHKIIATNVGAESIPLILAKELEVK